MLYVFPAGYRALLSHAVDGAEGGVLALFVLAFGVILSMYGGGFATIPAYLADIFGTQFVGAIHGRLLTAWSTAGILGPIVVNYMRQAQIDAGVPREQVYDFTLYILAGMLALGVVCNLLVTPLSQRWFMSDDQVVAFQPAPQAPSHSEHVSLGPSRGSATLAATWLAVVIPIAWGVWVTLQTALALFA